MAAGRTDLADRFVGLTLPYHREATEALPAPAGSYGLDCYDPQAQRPAPVRPRPGSGGVEGWLDEVQVVPPQGTPPLIVRLAQEPGSSVVGVRVAGPLGLVLSARVATLLDVL